MSCVTKFLDRCHIEETSVLYYLPTSELRNKLSWAWFGAVMISPDPSFKIWPKKEKVSKFESKLLIGWSPGWVVIWIQSNSPNMDKKMMMKVPSSQFVLETLSMKKTLQNWDTLQLQWHDITNLWILWSCSKGNSNYGWLAQGTLIFCLLSLAVGFLLCFLDCFMGGRWWCLNVWVLCNLVVLVFGFVPVHQGKYRVWNWVRINVIIW